MSPVYSNRIGITVKLSWQLGITRINCIKNISEKTIVGSGQSRLYTGSGFTIEGNFSFTRGIGWVVLKSGNGIKSKRND